MNIHTQLHFVTRSPLRIFVLCIALILVAFMFGCANMTEREQQTAWIVGGIVVVGVALSLANDGDTTIVNCRQFIIIRADGSSDHVCQ